MDNHDILEQFNAFYKIKHEYEQNVSRLKNKIIHNPSLSKAEKRKRYLLIKPKCINCKKPVGTIFSTKDRKLIALCGANNPGSSQKPCKLNINIERGSIITLDKVIDALRQSLDEEKDEIIKTKLNLLFNFISEETALTQFKTQKSDYENTQSQYDKYLKQLILVTELMGKKESINSYDIQIYETIQEIKSTLIQATNDDSGSHQLIHDSIEMVTGKLTPLITLNNSLKYKYRGVIFNSELNTFNIIEKPYIVSDTEIIVDTAPTIISNIK